MGPFAVGGIVFASLSGGAILGMALGANPSTNLADERLPGPARSHSSSAINWR
jgi:hypothetical protein